MANIVNNEKDNKILRSLFDCCYIHLKETKGIS